MKNLLTVNKELVLLEKALLSNVMFLDENNKGGYFYYFKKNINTFNLVFDVLNARKDGYSLLSYNETSNEMIIIVNGVSKELKITDFFEYFVYPSISIKEADELRRHFINIQISYEDLINRMRAKYQKEYDVI